MVTCIDFSEQNGKDFKSPEAMHCIDKKTDNDYENAIEGIGGVLIEYDDDRKVQAFGFAGIPHYPKAKDKNYNKNNKEVQNFFPLSGQMKTT